MKTIISTVLLTVTAAVAGWFFGASGQQPVPQEFATRRAATDNLVQIVNALGVIKPQTGAEVRVGSQLSGIVRRLYVDVGDAVQAGQLLAELDDTLLKTETQDARAAIDVARAELEFSESQLRAVRDNAFTTKTELDGVIRTVEVARARYAQALSGYELKKIRESYSKIVAPITGTVASVSTQQGETVAASFAAPTFMTVVDLGRLEIRAYVDESDIGKIFEGQPVTFTVDTYPGELFDGEVRGIYPSATVVNNVVNYIVIIAIGLNSDWVLRPEMTAHVQFEIARRTDVITVPRRAVLRESGASFVIVAGDNSYQKRAVQLGVIDTGNVEIIGGLTAGERYLLDGQQWAEIDNLR